MNKILALSALAFGVGLMTSIPASAAELLTNGGFETGNFTGWNIINNGGTGGCGSNIWAVNSTGAQGCSANGTTTAAPISGSYAAFNTFDGQQGSYQLSQSFVVPNGVQKATLSFLDEFHMNYSGASRVLEAQIFDSTNTTLLQTLYSVDVGYAANQAWTSVSADATSALVADAGRTVTLRLTEVIPTSYTGPGGLGIDKISLTEVPEPTTLALLGMGMIGLAVHKRRRAV